MKLRPFLEAARARSNELATGVALTLAFAFGVSAIVRFEGANTEIVVAEPVRNEIMSVLDAIDAITPR